jgi:regulator of protease activity HflC (stomatin/prohibitin superfamily)
LDDSILYSAYYKLDKPVEQILAYLEEYFRFHGMEYTLDEMFAAKNDMTHELQALLNEKMNPYGFIICNILVIDIDPDAKVKEAMNDIIASEKEKRAQQSRAEAEKVTKILAAEAEAKTRELAGEGIANARKAIIAGLQTSVENFQQAIPDSDPNAVMVTVMMTQYMDTVKEAAQNGKNTFILPSSPAQITLMEEQLRASILMGKHK